MKFYYVIAILTHFFAAILLNNENKKSYMLHLWKQEFCK